MRAACYGGTVVLDGTTDSLRTKREIGSLVADDPAVARVVDKLEVRGSDSPSRMNRLR